MEIQRRIRVLMGILLSVVGEMMKRDEHEIDKDNTIYETACSRSMLEITYCEAGVGFGRIAVRPEKCYLENMNDVSG
jgi:hypothetical protein